MKTHRGVPLDSGQSAARLRVVRGDIDAAHALTDPQELVQFAGDVARAPESRLYAAAKAEALWDQSAEERTSRPTVDLAVLHASVAGLYQGSEWLHTTRYCSDFDMHPERAAKREKPLD